MGGSILVMLLACLRVSLFTLGFGFEPIVHVASMLTAALQVDEVCLPGQLLLLRRDNGCLRLADEMPAMGFLVHIYVDDVGVAHFNFSDSGDHVEDVFIRLHGGTVSLRKSVAVTRGSLT